MNTSRRSVPLWAALAGSGFAGVLVAVQSRVNGGLSQELGNGYVAAAVSFGSGLVIMCIVLACSRAGRAGFAAVRQEVAHHRLPWWALCGGAAGAFFVLNQGLVAPSLGLALFTVGIVAGQVLGGLVFDLIGLGPGGRIAPTLQRVIGTVLAILAVGVAVVAEMAGGHAVWLVAVPVVIGAGMAWQSSVNGLVRSAAQSAVTATFINFAVGATILIVAALVSVAVQGFPTGWPTNPGMYIGGFVGTIFIALAAILVRSAGVLLLSMSNVAGQLIAAVVFEIALPLAGVSAGQLVGAAVALLAVVVAALPGTRRSRETR